MNALQPVKELFESIETYEDRKRARQEAREEKRRHVWALRSVIINEVFNVMSYVDQSGYKGIITEEMPTGIMMYWHKKPYVLVSCFSIEGNANLVNDYRLLWIYRKPNEQGDFRTVLKAPCTFINADQLRGLVISAMVAYRKEYR